MKKPSVGFEWSYRDLLFTMMIAFMAMSIMALIITTKKLETDSINQGNILIELFWDKTITADIDLWVKAPNEKSVGYSRKNGITFNLLRDDLGRAYDPESRNSEIAVGRGIKSGEYIVNIHRFSSITESPISCTISVTVHKNGTTVNIFKEKHVLTLPLEEATVARFTLDETGHYNPASFNKVFRSLREDK
jgi:hypothetical protein